MPSRHQITRSPDHQITKSNRQSPAILLTETKAGRDLVVSCCEQCLEAGVKPGMTLAHARALLPNVEPHIEAHAPARDREALRALAQWMIRFVPLVALDPPDGLLLDITGCERLYKGERNLINRVAHSIERRGFHVRVASAPTFACARALARHGRRQRSMVPPYRVREALSPLPVRALGIDEETEDALREIAIDRIGHLFDLPRNSLPARFGDELLLRLDQALGHAIEMIEPVRPAPLLVVERLFNGPVQQLEAIQITVRELLADLSRQLLARESGVRLLLLTLDRSDLDPLSLSIALSHTSRDAKHLWSLLSPHIERANMGFGIERVALGALEIDRLPHEQGEIEQRHEEAVRLAASARGATGKPGLPMAPGINRQSPLRLVRARGELIDTLINRLGCEGVLRLEAVEAHIPERAFRMRPVMEKKTQRHEGTEARRKKRREKETRRGGWTARRSGAMHGDARRPAGQFGPRETAGATRSISNHQITKSPDHQISITPHDRPTMLFDHPEPVEVLAITPESPPSRITWRDISYEVHYGCGPERIGEMWWSANEVRTSPQIHKSTNPHQITRSPDHQIQSSIVNHQSAPLILLQRNYYRVLLEDGRWLWVFRHLLTGRWFVHGEWA